MKKLFNLSFVIFSLIIISCSDNGTTPQNDEVLVGKLKSIIDSVMTNSHVPGMIIGIWAPNKNLPSWIYTTGKSDLKNNISMNSNQHFRIGSNTKTFTISVLLQLVDEKLLSLDDKLSKYFPNYPNADNITIEMLTDMTSGYYNYSAVQEFNDSMSANPKRVWTPDQLINIGINHTPYSAPGTEFHYSNTNTIILGKLIETLTHNSLTNEIKTRIVDKLGLSDTYLPVSGTDLTGNYCRGYYLEVYDSTNPEYTSTYDISWAWAAGGIVSNLPDIKNYVEHLVNGGLLSDTLQQRRMTFKRQITPTAAYGIGCFNLAGFIGHNGGLPGYTSVMLHSKDRNCTIIIFFNCQLNDATPDALFKKLAQTIYNDIVW